MASNKIMSNNQIQGNQIKKVLLKNMATTIHKTKLTMTSIHEYKRLGTGINSQEFQSTKHNHINTALTSATEKLKNLINKSKNKIKEMISKQPKPLPFKIDRSKSLAFVSQPRNLREVI